MYHYSSNPKSDISFELTWREVGEFVEKSGFKIEDESFHSAHYCDDPMNMLRSEYKCGFFKAKKIQKFNYEIKKKDLDS